MDSDKAADTGLEDISPDSPEEEDDDSVHSSTSSSDFTSDESDAHSPMDVGYGTPVLDEDKNSASVSGRKQRTVHIVDEMEEKSTERSGQDFTDNRALHVSSAESSLTKTHTKLQEANSPRIEIKIKNDKSFSRVSIEDQVELDFDESEDEDLRRDWRGHEKRVTQDKMEESSEEGAISDDDEEEGEVGPKVAVKITRTLGEEGEDDDCEEGEIKSSDEDTSSPDEDALDEIENPQYYEDRVMCRYFQWGNCHFGLSCRFLHPGVNDYDYGRPPPGPQYQPPPPPIARNPPPAAISASVAASPQGPAKWAAPSPVAEKVVEKKPSPSPDLAPTSPPTESAWERGLRHAKKMRELAKKRKEKETNFEEKRMNLSLEVDDEKEMKEKARPKLVVKSKDRETVRITRELSDDKENIELDQKLMSVERDPEPYTEHLSAKHDPHFDKNYQENYYDDHRGPQEPPPVQQDDNWGRNQHYDNYYAREWDNRESDYPPNQYREQRYNKEYPPQRGKYERGGGGGGYNHREGPPYQRREPPHQGPPPRDMSPDKEREYWDRRREEDYKKFNKFNALRENVGEEGPVNRTRGEQWNDPWARVKEPPRRKGSRSRSRSHGRKGRRSHSNSSSSSFSSGSRSRSRSSYSSSSYTSRSSYSSSSSRSRSRSQTKRSKEKSKPVKLHARPPKSAAAVAAAAAKPVEGPPKSTVTKVSQQSEDKHSGNTGPSRPTREPERNRPGQPTTRGPPKGPHTSSRDRGSSSRGSGPPPHSGRGGPPPAGRMGGGGGPPNHPNNRTGAPPLSRSGGPPGGSRPPGAPPGGNRQPGGPPGGSRLPGGPPSSSRSGDRPPSSSRSGGPSGRGSAPGRPGGSGPASSKDPGSQSKGPLHQRIDKMDRAPTAPTSSQQQGGGGGYQSKPGRDKRPAAAPSSLQKREEMGPRSRKDLSQKTASPKVASSDRKERDTRQLPGRMKPKLARKYSSSSSSRSRSRSYSRSFSRSRSSRGSSVSSSSSSSSASSYTSGSADSQHLYKGIKSSRDDNKRPDTSKVPDPSQRKVEGDRSSNKRNVPDSVSSTDRGASQYSNLNRRDREPHLNEKRDFNRDRKPPAQEHQSQGRPPAEQYGRSQRDSREDRRGERGGPNRGGGTYMSRSGRSTEQSTKEEGGKADNQKAGIKLTLKSNDKVTRPTKRGISNGSSDLPSKKGKIEDNQERRKLTGGKQESTDKADSASGSAIKDASPGEQPKKKSTSSRREELLKQLKAVEHAITRKRTKMS